LENIRIEQTERLLIKNAHLIDPRSKWHDRKVDLFIEGEFIKDIGPDLEYSKLAVVDAKDQFISPGWVDLRAFVREPGAEHQETILTALNAAAAGGFSSILAHPSTDSPIQKASDVQYMLSKAEGHLVDLNICAALSADLEGKELSEMYDLYRSGASGFGNGNHPYRHGGLLQRALLYTSGFKSMVFSHAIDSTLEHGGIVNESESTIHSGMRLAPALAEYAQIQKEIEIARYCEQGLHFSHISSAESVQLIRRAKQEGLNISCDVSIMHLCYTDAAVLEYDSHFKLNPPLRTEKDRQALILGLKDGTIDAVVSDHQPLNVEGKQIEFDFASPGVMSLQTVFPMYHKYLRHDIPFETWIEAISLRPAALLGRHLPVLREGEKANFSLFHPSVLWTFNKHTNQSISENHPLFNSEITGKCTLTVNNGRLANHHPNHGT
jgi:dihydroorotase